MTRDRFKQIVGELGDRVHTYAVWLTRDPHAAQDLTQEAFMRLWEHRDDVQEGASRAWLMRVVWRMHVDRFRRARPDRAGGADVVLSLLESNRDESGLDHESKRALAEAFVSLSPRDQALVQLHDVQGLSGDDIAGVLGMSVGSVRVALHRARRRLAAMLEGEVVPA